MRAARLSAVKRAWKDAVEFYRTFLRFLIFTFSECPGCFYFLGQKESKMSRVHPDGIISSTFKSFMSTCSAGFVRVCVCARACLCYGKSKLPPSLNSIVQTLAVISLPLLTCVNSISDKQTLQTKLLLNRKS